jgi:ABC-2 type transport system ATP-binding protein
MRQRLGLGAALLGEPRILILDEPANGLDPQGIRWLRDFLRGFAAEGNAVLVSSHLMSELVGTADHLIVIGRVSPADAVQQTFDCPDNIPLGPGGSRRPPA